MNSQMKLNFFLSNGGLFLQLHFLPIAGGKGAQCVFRPHYIDGNSGKMSAYATEHKIYIQV